MKIVNIVGARPQFIKYVPVLDAIERYANQTGSPVDDILIHTGQHYDYNMSKIFFDGFGIKEPDYHLEVGSGDHGKQTGEILRKTEEVLLKEKPDVVVLYGDTNTTLGGALAASKLHILVAHVESGLRSFNKYMPEEINRIVTDQVSTFLFCPCKNAVKQLEKEGFSGGFENGDLVSEKKLTDRNAWGKYHKNNPLVVNVGDVMYDVLLKALQVAEKESDIFNAMDLSGREYGVLTLHRAENTNNPETFNKIVSFVNDIAEDKKIFFPMHPRTKKIYSELSVDFSDNIHIIEPLSYFDLIVLLKNSSLLLTDSGGMQKEAYWLKVPCITLREETEWIETLESGWNILFGKYSGTHNVKDAGGLLYGDGHAAEKIIAILGNCVND
ncbi:UDP-N-acetyl glucosamine 2-epimerase [Candidatus Latescibacterota bacterium]